MPFKKPNDSEQNKQLFDLFKNETFEIWENYDNSDGTHHESSELTKKFSEVTGLKDAMDCIATLNDKRDTWDRNNMHFEYRSHGLAKSLLFSLDNEGNIVMTKALEELLQIK
mgnify:CR=1 FL=1